MKRLELRSFGDPRSNLHLVNNAEVRQPGSGELRVRMLASPINPSDLMMIRGSYSVLPKLPCTPGFEGVGIVEAAGPGLLGKYYRGKRVAMLVGEGGCWAETNIVPAKQVAPVPNELSDEQAAMFFVNPATTLILARYVLKVPKGGWLVVTAAGSALGKMMIRLGKHDGFKTLAIVRSEKSIGELTRLGADAVLVTTSPNFEQELKHRTGGGPRYVIDCVGGELGSQIVRCMGPGGRMICYGTLDNEPLRFSPRDLMTPGATLEGFWLGNWMRKQSILLKLGLIRSMGQLIKSGVLSVETPQTFSLDQHTAAMEAALDPNRRGKIVFTMR